jgi:transposase
MRRSSAVWPGEAKTALRPGGFWHLRRSMTATRTEAAKIGGVGVQIIRDWVLRFNARGFDALLNGNQMRPHHLDTLQ